MASVVVASVPLHQQRKRFQHETGSKLFFLQRRRRLRHVPPKGHLIFNGLYTVISPGRALFAFSLFSEIPEFGDASDHAIQYKLYVYNAVVSLIHVTDMAPEGRV
jgi:hypothetical protein